MTSPSPIDAATAKRETATQDARDQAADFDGFAKSEWYIAPNGERFEVPNIALLDDDQQERFDKLQHRFQQCDKAEPTVLPERFVPEQIAREVTVDDDGNEVVSSTQLVTAAYTIPERIIPPPANAFITPYRINGELVTPSYNIQLVQAFLGEDGYAKFKAAGGKSSEYGVIVSRLNGWTAQREASDSKSDGSVSVVADVSD